MTLSTRPPSRVGGPVGAAVGVLGGGTAVSTLAGAPWWVVSIALVATIAVPATLGLAQIVMPQESSDKRELLVELLHYRERRALARRPRRRSTRPGRRR